MGNKIVVKGGGSKVLTDDGAFIDWVFLTRGFSPDWFLAFLEITELQKVSKLSADRT